MQERYSEILRRLWCEKCEVPYGATLSDRDIKRLVEQKRIIIDPQPDLDDVSILGTCKIDLHLGREAMFIEPTEVGEFDLSEPIPEEYYRRVDLIKRGLIIPSNRVVIAVTLEKLTLPDDIIGILVGKSGNARRGLKVEAAPVFDAGWDGHPILELQNTSGIALRTRYGQPICAMYFQHLSSPALRPYAQSDGVRYRNQTRVQL